MAQFSVYQNNNPASKRTYPYLLDVQYPLLESLDTRLVIPLIARSSFKERVIRELNPSIKVKNIEHLLLIQQMAAIRKDNLGPRICDCSENRQEIIFGIDFLITGF